MKRFLRVVAVGGVGLLLLGAGFYTWASATSSRSLARSIDSHAWEVPVPYPLEVGEMEARGLTSGEAEAEALARALERGRHLVEARYACGECHGSDFGGGVMVDAFPIGRLLGPNLTSGRGGVTASYTTADWDRIIRHGILPGGRPAVMPSEDFLLMSDQELSDIIAYIRSLPPVDNEVPPIRLGPLGKLLVASGEFVFSADLIDAHDAPHAELPPPAEVSVAFGRHLSGVCTGCHAMDLAGGKIAGGDPGWVAAANLTPHADGLRDWSYEDFRRAMLESRRPDGSEIREPMSFVAPFAQNMTEVEMEAIWTYLRSIEARPTGR